MRPRDLESKSGLIAQSNANASIRRLFCDGTMLNLFLPSEIEGGPAEIYLRRRDQRAKASGLLRPAMRKVVRRTHRCMTLQGEW